MQKHTAVKSANKTEDIDSANPVVEATSIQKSEKSLTKSEQQQLAKCESKIEKGLSSYIEVAEALSEIHQNGLYRESYDTFNEYCTKRWKFTARYGNRLLSAAEVTHDIKSDQLVSSIPAALPQNEAQARPLSSLNKKQRVEAARKVATKTNEPTAKDFEKAAAEVLGPKPKEAEEETSTDKDLNEVSTAFESNIIPLPKELVPMAKIAEMIQTIYNIYTNSQKKQDGLKMFGELQRCVDGWVKWENEQKEAA